MISPSSLLGALRRAEEVLHKLGVSSAWSLQQCIEHVVNRKPHPPPNISVIIYVPNIIYVEKKEVEYTYCASGEDEISAQLREAEGAKMLLLEIIRRAAFDWVLYRDSKRPEQKALAEEAVHWLFVEEGGDDAELRRRERKEFTSFLSICDALDMDTHRVRDYVTRLSPSRVGSSRHPTERKPARRKPPALPAPKKRQQKKAVDYDDVILRLMDEDDE